MTRLFLSYRREDTADICGRLYDRLETRFGHANVFKDVDTIPPGVDFRSYITAALANCDVVLVLIGARWLDSVPGQSAPRLFAQNDFVRIEVESALRLRKVIVPVLVNNATMPPAGALPPSIAGLTYINASRLRPDPDFRHDSDVLMNSIAVYGDPAHAAYAASPSSPTQPSRVTPGRAHPLSQPTRLALRWTLATLGVLALGFGILYAVLNPPVAAANPSAASTATLMLYIATAIDVLGSTLALVLVARSRKWEWLLWLFLMFWLAGLGPLIYAFKGPME